MEGDGEAVDFVLNLFEEVEERIGGLELDDFDLGSAGECRGVQGVQGSARECWGVQGSAGECETIPLFSKHKSSLVLCLSSLARPAMGIARFSLLWTTSQATCIWPSPPSTMSKLGGVFLRYLRSMTSAMEA